MKFNFKKITSVIASTVMLGSTIAFAAAATWPAPFVEDGTAKGAVVYGATAASTDYSAALDLQTDLNKDVTVSAGETTVTGGDFVKLERSSDKFNLNDAMGDFYPNLDEDELSTVLAQGVYSNDANDEFEYDQKITFGSNLNLTHFQDSEFNNDEPIIGFDLTDGAIILNYTLEFTDDAEAGSNLWGAGNDLETTDLTLLGRSYYLLSARNSSGVDKITLLDTANSAIVTQGETSTITTASSSYDVSIEYIDSDEVILNVDGVSTNKLEEGGVYKVADNVYVAVKSILYDQKEAGISKAEISVGSGKILLENGAEVEINNEDVKDMKFDVVGSDDQVKYGLRSTITKSTNDLSKIELEWRLEDDNWIAPGTELTMPGFETIKLSMGDFIMPSPEKTMLNGDSDYVAIDTTITEGAVVIPILYTNSTNSGIEGLGKKTKEKLVTNDTTSPSFNLNETENSYFAVSWISGDDSETYVYQISGIDEQDDGDNETSLTNLADGKDLTLKELTDYETNGQVKVTLTAANEDLKTATVLVEPTSGGTVYGDRIVTKKGLQIRLPVDNATLTTDGYINISAVPTSWVMNVSEEDKDGNIDSGETATVTIAIDGTDGLEPTDITGVTLYETSDGSDQYVGYAVSDLATKILQDKPTNGLNDVEVYYAGEESYAEVFISEAEASVSGAAGTGIVVVKDTEVDSVKDKNLVVVGGSCINTVAASMLGLSEGTCGEAFSAATNVGAGQYLIEVGASPVNANKMAMLVAGYNAADTESAVTKVLEGSMSTDVGSQVYPQAA